MVPEIVYRGQPISIELTPSQVRLRLHPHTAQSITVCVKDQVSVLSPGDVHVVALRPKSPINHGGTETLHPSTRRGGP